VSVGTQNSIIIVFNIVAMFFSVNMITVELLHLAWWKFAQTCN